MNFAPWDAAHVIRSTRCGVRASTSRRSCAAIWMEATGILRSITKIDSPTTLFAKRTMQVRRVFGFLFVLAGASSAIAVGSPSVTPKKPVATPTHAVVVKTVVRKTKIVLAPADEYFGPMKMSIPGIRNEIHLLDMQYAVNHDAHQKIVGMAQQAEASLLDWEKKYPSDTMLARHVYLLEHLLRRN